MPDNNETKIALERYRNVIGYFQYENTMYWTRSSFIMIAQAAIIGFSFRLFPVESEVKWTQLVIILITGVIGMALCVIWKMMNESAIWWINRWLEILKKIEPAAYGDIAVFREIENESKDAKVHSVRRASNLVRWVFIFIWSLFIAYAILVGFVKAHCGI